MRGTLLNTATVAAGASVGWAVGQGIPESYKEVALSGLGLVTAGMGVRLFLRGKNPLVAAVAVAAGGVLGLALGLHSGVEALEGWLSARMGGGGGGLVTAFVLFCVGPMTLLGCLQDALEGKIELLALKSTMDGIAAVFLAAASGAGVLASAGLVLLFQGALTLLARPLRPLAEDEDALAELSATGGALLIAIGLGLLQIKDLRTANYLPAIFLAPLIVILGRRLGRRRLA